MKAKRLFFLVMAICLTNGVQAQFYDGPDDIYYYVEEYNLADEYIWNGSINFSGYYTGKTLKTFPKEGRATVYIFNFDGTKAALLGSRYVEEVKENLAKKTSYYEDKIETTEYRYNYVSSSASVVTYIYKDESTTLYNFSKDRNTLTIEYRHKDGSHTEYTILKRVSKSYFRIGRSRTPSGTMYE